MTTKWLLTSQREIKFRVLDQFLKDHDLLDSSHISTMKCNFDTPDQPLGSGIIASARTRLDYALNSLEKEGRMDEFEFIVVMENGIIDQGTSLVDVNYTLIYHVKSNSYVYGISMPVKVMEKWYSVIRENADYTAPIAGAPIKLGKLMAEADPDGGIDPNNWFASVEGCPDRSEQIMSALESAWAKYQMIRRINHYPNFPNEKCPDFEDLMSIFAIPGGTLVMTLHIASEICNVHGFIPNIIIGPEFRGAPLAAALSAYLSTQRVHTSLVFPRKPGKLPGTTVSTNFEKEYGSDTLEMQTAAFHKSSRVIIIDDVLATGGTMNALVRLVVKQGIPFENIHVVVLREIEPLRDKWRTQEYLGKVMTHIILGAGEFGKF